MVIEVLRKRWTVKVWGFSLLLIPFIAHGQAANTFPASGDVGIGTTSPIQPLSVNASDGWASIGLMNNGTPSAEIMTDPGNNLHISTNGTNQGYLNTRLTILSNGYLGIGTTAPSQKLSINQGALDFDNFGYASSYRSPNNNYTNLFLGGSIFDTGNGTYTVQTDGGSNYFAAIRMDNSGGNAGAINFYTAPAISGSSYSLSNTQLASYLRMTILGSNVGIGTSSPGAKLEVNGNLKLTANSGASITFQDGTTQTTAYTGVTCGVTLQNRSM